MRRTSKPVLVPCDHDAPRRCPVEGPSGWYTREWEPGEKVAYKQKALMKPAPQE